MKTADKQSQALTPVGVSLPVLFILLGVVMAVTVLLSIMVGRYTMSFSQLAGAFTGRAGEGGVSAFILVKVRLSRIAGALLIGGALSLSGAVYQGMFRNPMVSPDILGASAGAGFGASLGIAAGLDGIWVQALAFGFGLAAVMATYGIGRFIEGGAGGGVMVLVLTGMVLSALFSAFISIIKYAADPYDTLPQITFWLMGGLSYVTAADAAALLLPFITGTVPLLLLSWQLNVLSLGEEEAKTLGVNVGRLRALFVLCATLLTSSAVAVGGMIGWVGLIIPHLARMLVGVNHRYLLPASLMIGASFLLVVDDLARSVLPQEIPLSILTAVLGAPLFLYLLFVRQRS